MQVVAWVLLVTVMGVFGCDSVKSLLFTPRIQVKCQMPVGLCIFRNYGDPGQLCVQVEVFHEGSATVLRSDPVCSGPLDRLAPAEVAVRFSGGDPIELCMGKDMKQDFAKTCRVEVLGK